MPLIPRGHEHLFRPVAEYPAGDDGTIMRHSRCSDVDNCGLEEKRYLKDGELTGVLYRVRGVWVHPLDLLRMGELPVVTCPECDGAPGPIGECATCGNVGVVDREPPETVTLDPVA
jgi:hypothetical protein